MSKVNGKLKLKKSSLAVQSTPLTQIAPPAQEPSTQLLDLSELVKKQTTTNSEPDSDGSINDDSIKSENESEISVEFAEESAEENIDDSDGSDMDKMLLQARSSKIEDPVDLAEDLEDYTNPAEDPENVAEDAIEDVIESPKKRVKKSTTSAKNTEEKTVKKRASAKKTTKKTASAVKKGPGRPRKVPKKDPIPRKGIVAKPTNSEDVIEFLYDTPVILKKLIAFFKSLAAAQIQVLFRTTDIILYAQDHHKKSKIRVRIDAAKLNHYYCKAPLDIGITCKDLELLLNKVDKEYSSIILLSTAGNTKKTLTVVFENDIQIDESHTIDLIENYTKMTDENEFVDEDYGIQFEWPGKYFKKTINDIKTISTELSITQADSDSPLTFEYKSANKKIHSYHTVKNKEKIKLKSNLGNSDSFRVDVKVDYIRPISSAQIADEITIMVDETKKLMTKAFIDNKTIEIKTLTDIVDQRPAT